MRKIRKNNPIFIFLVVFGLLIFLHGVGALRPLENLFLNLVKPINSQFYRWGNSLNSSYKNNESQVTLAIKVESLTKEVARLTMRPELIGNHPDGTPKDPLVEYAKHIAAQQRDGTFKTETKGGPTYVPPASAWSR